MYNLLGVGKATSSGEDSSLDSCSSADSVQVSNPSSIWLRLLLVLFKQLKSTQTICMAHITFR